MGTFVQGRCQGQGIEKILGEKDISTIRERVTEYLKTHPNSTGILYLRTLIETNARKAIEQYEQLIYKYPACAYVDDARFKIAQYHYARGYYETARRKFREIIQKHPNSALSDDAAYFAAQCLLANKDEAGANRELQTFINKYPNSALQRLAKKDLQEQKQLRTSSGRSNRRRSSGELPALQSNTTTENKQTDTSRWTTSSSSSKSVTYTLQIGAFSTRANAYNQKNYFIGKGYRPEVSTKNVNGKTLFIVTLNRFSTRDAARALGEKLKSRYSVEYVVVECRK